MLQQNLLLKSKDDSVQGTNNLLSKDGQLQLLNKKISTNFEALKASIAWKHEKIRIFGRWILQPRLTAWYGDQGTDYVYSGLKNSPLPWTEELLVIKAQVEEISASSFNSVLLNYYRDGQDSMGWHQDNETELGKSPSIASLSLGASREFQCRHKFDKSLPKVKCLLENGSLLLMSGSMQEYWQHQIPKTKRTVGERINLTFRSINK